jgi:recombination protein RecA
MAKKMDKALGSLDALYKKYEGQKPKLNDSVRRLDNPFPSFDRYLGGGPGIGKITTYAGKYSTGKTSLALQMAGYNKDADIGFLDCEFEWTEASYKWVYDYFGIERERIHVLQPEYLEEAANIVYDMCDICDIIIHDGLTSIGSAAEFQDDMQSTKMGTDARIINKFFKKFRGRVYKTDTALLMTNKVYDNIGNTFEPIVEPGGKGVGYYPAQKLRLSLANAKDGTEVIGQKVNVTVNKDKLSGNRGKRFTLYYYNGVGFDILQDVVDNAVDFDIINKSGSWYAYDGTKLGQGSNKVKEFIKDNEGLEAEIRARIDESIIEERINIENESEENLTIPELQDATSTD